MKVIKDLRILNAIGKRYHLEFDSQFKYYTGDAYKNNIGQYLPLRFEYKDKVYKLTYFDGCFNPFLTVKKESEIGNTKKCSICREVFIPTNKNAETRNCCNVCIELLG